VVFYLGYGNHEEVLKCDVLPVTAVVPTQALAYQPTPAATVVQQTVAPVVQHSAGLTTVVANSQNSHVPVEERSPTDIKKRYSNKNVMYQRTYIPPGQRNQNNNNNRPNYS